MRTNSLLTPCKQGAVLSRYSIGLGSENELLKPNFFRLKNFNLFYYFKFQKSLESPPRTPTLRRNFPQTPRKKFLSNVDFSTSEVKIPFFWSKKEEKTRCLWALSSLLVQR